MLPSILLVPAVLIYLVLLGITLLPDLLASRRDPESPKSLRFQALPLHYKLLIFAGILPLVAGITAVLVFLPGQDSMFWQVLRLLWGVAGLPLLYVVCELACVRWYKQHGYW